MALPEKPIDGDSESLIFFEVTEHNTRRVSCARCLLCVHCDGRGRPSPPDPTTGGIGGVCGSRPRFRLCTGLNGVKRLFTESADSWKACRFAARCLLASIL